MQGSDDDFWRRFDELDGRRRLHSRARDDAFRRLSPLTARSDDSESRERWRQYCESVDKLEESIAELERLVWRMK
jgi:hypothetical protein